MFPFLIAAFLPAQMRWYANARPVVEAMTNRRCGARAGQSVLLVALVVASVALLGVGREGRAEAAGPSIAVDMAPAAPGVQSSTNYPADATEITVNVVAQDVSGIGAFEFGLVIPFGLQFASWAPGPLLGSTGRVPSCLQTPKNPEGRVYIACATAGPVPTGASGSGLLASLRLRVLVPLDVCLEFFLADIANIAGDPQSPANQGGCAAVTAAVSPTASPTLSLVGDVDGDCRVSVMDFTRIGSRFGYSFGSLLYVPTYDLNHNGSIDIFDLQIAASHFTQHC